VCARTGSASISVPANPSSAGSRVVAASIATATTTAAEWPSPVTGAMPATVSDSSAMTTVDPAKSTAAPTVRWAIPTAPATSMPARRASRYRVIRKSA
jgi:hypothetical protein